MGDVGFASWSHAFVANTSTEGEHAEQENKTQDGPPGRPGRPTAFWRMASHLSHRFAAAPVEKLSLQPLVIMK
jgi:hypothetical protein